MKLMQATRAEAIAAKASAKSKPEREKVDVKNTRRILSHEKHLLEVILNA